MSASRAVLASFDLGSELCHMIENNDCGICVELGNVEQFVETILKLKSDDELLKKFGRNSREFDLNNIFKDMCT